MTAKNMTLEGKFKNDKLIDNKGVMEYKNGDKYIGQVKDMRRNGQGKLILAKGGHLEGKWVDDYIINGVLKIKDEYEYKGTFKDNLIHG